MLRLHNMTQVSLWVFWTVGYYNTRVKPGFSSPALERRKQGTGETPFKRILSLDSTFNVRLLDPSTLPDARVGHARGSYVDQISPFFATSLQKPSA